MSLANATLSELARKNAGIGRVAVSQSGSPYSSFPTPAPNSGDGVDVSGAVWCEVIVRPIGGSATFTILGRSTGDTVFDAVNQGSPLTATVKGFKELMRCPTLDEVAVQIDSISGATSVEVIIAPCGG